MHDLSLAEVLSLIETAFSEGLTAGAFDMTEDDGYAPDEYAEPEVQKAWSMGYKMGQTIKKEME